MIILHTIEGNIDHAARRAAAQNIVRQECGCDIIRDEMGAPSVNKDGVFISISHTDRFVAVAFSHKEVGVDIELLPRQVDHLAARFASEGEVEICRAVMGENPTLLVWCAKEAIYKTLHRAGVDLLRDMKITSATPSHLLAMADGHNVELTWETSDNILTVCTI